jgi:hypothetical protein
MAKQISGAKNHTHKYILANKGANGKEYWVYKCATCPHYLPAVDAEGLDTVCWVCSKTCQVPKGRPGKRRVKRPHCLECTKVYNRADVKAKPEVDLKKLSEMSLEDLLGDDADNPIVVAKPVYPQKTPKAEVN